MLRATGLALVASLTCVLAAEDPASAFLEAYQAFKAGERLEREGNLSEALARYRSCVEQCEEIQKTAPDYQPVVIEFRTSKARQKILAVEELAAQEGDDAVGEEDFGLEGPLPTFDPEPLEPTIAPRPRLPRIDRPSSSQAIEPPSQPNFSTYRIPQPGSGAAKSPSSTAVAPPTDLYPGRSGAGVDPAPSVGGGAVRAMEEEIRALRLSLKQEEFRSEELSRKLLESQAQGQMALHELDRTKVNVVELKSQLAMSRQARGDLEATNERLAAEKGRDASRIAKLQADLVAARADLEVAEDYNGELFAKLESAASYIESSEAIREQLSSDRTTLAAKLKEGVGEETVRIEAENAKLRKERDTAVAEAERAADLTTENAELVTKLTAAEERVEKLAALDPERERMIADLRGELESVQLTIADLQTERTEGQAQIAELQTQLEDTAKAAASATGAIAKENELLKDIVTRQIRDQAKRQQARQLVQEEMEKLEVRSSSVIEQLTALADAETELSDQEKRLVSGPEDAAEEQRQAQVGSVRGPDFSMVVEKDVSDDTQQAEPGEVVAETAQPENDLPESLVPRAGEAFARMNDGNFLGAAEIYREIFEAAPNSYFAAVSLGVAELGLGELDSSVAAFRRALEL
ncbi:MAG: hypothetical protein WA771_01645, partial [Chthoniobacterales bacterium]